MRFINTKKFNDMKSQKNILKAEFVCKGLLQHFRYYEHFHQYVIKPTEFSLARKAAMAYLEKDPKKSELNRDTLRKAAEALSELYDDVILPVLEDGDPDTDGK